MVRHPSRIAPGGEDPTWAARRRPSLSLRLWVSYRPMTRAHVRLLGPCFKTGRVECRQTCHKPSQSRPASPTPIAGERSGDTVAQSLPVELTRRGGWPRSARRSLGPAAANRGRLVGTRAPPPTTLPACRRKLTEPVVALCPRKVHAAEPGSAPRSVHKDPETRRPRAARRAEFRGPTLRIHPFTSARFHVLLNSLFKVLFNFPSRYLSAIGLVPVFSLRWSLPPALGCIPKQPDS